MPQDGRDMDKVVRERRIAAPVEMVWAQVEDVDRLARWLAFADRIEVLSGSGTGRRQRLHGRWRGKRSEVDQVVVDCQPQRRLAWRHEAERLDGRPARVFAKETRFEIGLEPIDGTTLVRLVWSRRPASAARGVALRLLGKRDAVRRMEWSLRELDARVTSGQPGARP